MTSSLFTMRKVVRPSHERRIRLCQAEYDSVVVNYLSSIWIDGTKEEACSRPP